MFFCFNFCYSVFLHFSFTLVEIYFFFFFVYYQIPNKAEQSYTLLHNTNYPNILHIYLLY